MEKEETTYMDRLDEHKEKWMLQVSVMEMRMMVEQLIAQKYEWTNQASRTNRENVKMLVDDKNHYNQRYQSSLQQTDVEMVYERTSLQDQSLL